VHCASPYLQDHGDLGRSRGQDGWTVTDRCRGSLGEKLIPEDTRMTEWFAWQN